MVADIKYSSYIKGKSVILVGPSPNIIGSSQGEFIDSHDIVIRTNGAFPVRSEYQQDYGKRCDSLYVNSLFARETNLPIKEYSELGMSFLNMKQDSKNIAIRHRNSKLSIRVFTSAYQKSRSIISKNPLMGNYIIYEILKYNPGSLHVTGMSMYTESDITSHYIDDYLPKVCNPLKLDETRKKGHDQVNQNNQIKALILSNKITADETICKILSIL